jgi:hypothetical protein
VLLLRQLRHWLLTVETQVQYQLTSNEVMVDEVALDQIFGDGTVLLLSFLKSLRYLKTLKNYYVLKDGSSIIFRKKGRGDTCSVGSTILRFLKLFKKKTMDKVQNKESSKISVRYEVLTAVST